MTDITQEERYWLWFSSIDGIGPVRFYDTLSVFTDISSAFRECRSITARVQSVGKKYEQAICQSANEAYIDRILERCYQKDIHILTRLNRNYPQTLAEIEIRRRSCFIGERFRILTISPARSSARAGPPKWVFNHPQSCRRTRE